MPLLSIQAHYDGSQVHLDEKVDLPPDTRLIVTVLVENDTDRAAFLRLSESSLAAAYGDDDVEYSVADLLKTPAKL